MTGGQNYLPPWLERRNDLTVREYKNIVKSNTHPCKRFLEAPTNTIYFLTKAKIRHFWGTVCPRERFVTIETTWKAPFKSFNCKFTIIQPTILNKLYLVMRRLSNVGEAVPPKRRKKSAVRKTNYQNILQFVQLYLNFNSIIFACSLSKNCLKNNYFPHVWLALE